MTIPAYFLTTFTLLPFGLAFLLVWLVNRSSLPALQWGIAHLSLALAAHLGFGYQVNGIFIAGVMSAMFTALYLATLWAGAKALQDQPQGALTIVILTTIFFTVISVTGFLYQEFAGRMLVKILMTTTYAWIALIFYRTMNAPLLVAVFLLQTAVHCFDFIATETLSTVQHPVHMVLLHALVNTLLAALLVREVSLQSYDRLRTVLSHVTDGIYARNLEGKILFCNPAFNKLLQPSSGGDFSGDDIHSLAPVYGCENQDSDTLNETLQKTPPENLPLDQETDMSDDNGRRFICESLYTLVEDNHQPMILAQIRDITDRQAAEQQLILQATTDELTGLANRAVLQQQLQEPCPAPNKVKALLMVSINKYHQISYSLGPEQGDRLLQIFARRLNQIAQDCVVAARYSDSAFALIIQGQDHKPLLAQCDRIANRIQKMIETPFQLQHMPVLIDIAIGIALADDNDSEGLKQLPRQASSAMRHASHFSHPDVAHFSEEMDQKARETLELDSAMRHAMAHDNQFFLHFQPIVSIGSERIEKVEALLRWTHPSYGNITPDRFIPIAEQSRMIIDLGNWVIQNCCKQVSLWRQHCRYSPVVSINISARQLADPEFINHLMHTLSLYQVAPQEFELELTESILADDIQQVSEKLQYLRKQGFSLSLDDFGTGYSSLSYLASFDMNTVKIDRSFTMTLGTEETQLRLVEAIVAMAKSLNLQLVAEGVETETQRHQLTELGCDYLQGYLTGRPTTPDEIEYLIGKQVGGF